MSYRFSYNDIRSIMYYIRPLFYTIINVSLRSELVAIRTVLVPWRNQIIWALFHFVLKPLHFVEKLWYGRKDGCMPGSV